MATIYRLGGGGWLSLTPASSSQSGRRDLTLNTYFPDESNTGVLPDVARTAVSNHVPVAGQTYENLDIRNVVTPPYGTAKIVYRNCRFQGTAANPTSFTGLVRAYGNGHCPVEFYDCTFEPQTPHFFWVGVQGHTFRAVRCAFRFLTDAMQGFNNNTGMKDAAINVTLYQSWIGRHAYYGPGVDTSTTDGSHSDGFQIEGGSGYDIQGNTFTGLLDPRWTPNYYGDNTINAAMMIKPDVGLIAGLNVQHNYFGGGAASVNLANDPPDRQLGNVGTIANNTFGRNQRLQGGGGNNTYTILMPSNVTGTFTGNTYTDGQPITVRRNG